MSINVTVSGNPISINKGKMVTSDPNYAKKEFQKRRLMRLEQVRQQSKDIAEDIRNKVRNEKKKQLNKIEEEGKEKLRNWQNRKLLELQTQYKEALRELGTGHKQAVELEGESEVLIEQKEYNKELANQRNQVAATQLQIEKNRANLKKSVPIQQKKIVRDIENTRATLVSNIKKKKPEVTPQIKKKKKRKKADISISIPDSDSESEEQMELLNLETISEKDNSSNSVAQEESVDSVRGDEKTSCECSEDSEQPRRPLDVNENDLPFKFARDNPPRIFNPDPWKVKDSCREVPVDTRISDRIKRREIMASQLDYCDVVADTHPTPFIESNTQIRDAIDSRFRNKCTCEKMPDFEKEEDIPTKPPVKLKETDIRDSKPSLKEALETNDAQKVQFYDHPNRFSQEKRFPSGSYVEKITADSLEVIPNVTSEAEWYEKMRQRDKEARIRGQRALEKERIQKDYQEMMKKLPLLQKKERICEISKDKPEYHMSGERLKERERKKQNQLDNAYTKLFPGYKPAVVTLPSKKRDNEVIKLPDDEPTQSLNVGKWDVDHEQKMFTAEEVQEIIRSFTDKQKPKDRQVKLKQLLKSLKLQKEQLLREIKSLPKDDSINQLINDLNSFSDSDEKVQIYPGEKSERKRRREENEKDASTDSTTESSSSSYPTRGRGAKLKDKQRDRRHSEPAKVPSPRKKAKIKAKTKVLILQNTSTQTTPKASSTSSDQNKPKSQDKALCHKQHIPCDCNKENENSTEELCQILIKLNEKEDPEVVVKSSEQESKATKPKVKEQSSKQTESKSVGVGTDEAEKPLPTKKTDKLLNKVTQTSGSTQPKKSSKRKDKVDSKTDSIDMEKDKLSHVDNKNSKSKSWKEQLSKNSLSTTSTSYLSPPDFKSIEVSQVVTSSSDLSKESFYNLRRKPQQRNLHEASAAISVSQSQSSSNERIIEPNLLRYIKKLLSKSRESIENLTVSTSNVQTPSQSVVEMESNNPMAQLHNIIKYFNLRAEGIAQQLSYSPDSSPVHYNTSASHSEASDQQLLPEQNVKHRQTKSKEKRVVSDEAPSSVKSTDSISLQYADITDSCSRRIATLAAKINQIREEKIQMLQKSPGLLHAEKSKSSNVASSEKDVSTGYLDLPESRESSKHSSINSLDDEELHRRLVEIDMSLAKKLRRFSPVQEDKVTKDDSNSDTTDVADDSNNTDKELWMRVQRLLHQNIESQPVPSNLKATKDNNEEFFSFLSDIPKLPKLEIQPENGHNNSIHKRPPPSKGLTIAKKFNGNISLVPHELSTIIEADSQLSAKISSSQASPNASKMSQVVSPRKDFNLLIKSTSEEDHTSDSSTSTKPHRNVPNLVTKISVTSKKTSEVIPTDKITEKDSNTNSPLNLSYDLSSKSIIFDETGNKSTISSTKSVKMSSSSSDDMEAIEAMLKSIGMEWAIPTIHKTQEALALTSSSSSLNFSSKRSVKEKDSSSSEVSLKEYLRKRVLAKVSSSTLKSDVSAASLFNEFSELSTIQTNSGTEKGNRRTSTPLTISKSTSKSGKKVIFSEDSDISSVRDESQKHSDKYSFHSLSGYSHSKDSKSD